ncbi:hypothetical protein pb186bvf_000929 [Paramecium bursaria]
MQLQKQLIIVYGCPGSGKTTLSQQLGFTVHVDTIEQLLHIYDEETVMNGFLQYDEKIGEYGFQIERWKQSRRLALKLTEGLISDSNYQTIIIDDDLLLKSQRKSYKQLCRQYQCYYTEILIDLDKEILVQRNNQRVNTKKLGQLILDRIYNKLQKGKKSIIIGPDYDIQEVKQLIEDKKFIPKVEQKKQQEIQNHGWHQILELRLRSLISELCKKGYDGKQLSELKKKFKPDIHDIDECIIEFLKQL